MGYYPDEENRDEDLIGDPNSPVYDWCRRF